MHLDLIKSRTLSPSHSIEADLLSWLFFCLKFDFFLLLRQNAVPTEDLPILLSYCWARRPAGEGISIFIIIWNHSFGTNTICNQSNIYVFIIILNRLELIQSAGRVKNSGDTLLWDNRRILGKPIIVLAWQASLLTINWVYSRLGKHSSCSRAPHMMGQNDCPSC